jgi:dCTP deaminase
MSVLPDHLIDRAVSSGVLGIEPYSRNRLQPASYDLLLDNRFRRFKSDLQTSMIDGSPYERLPPIDPAAPEDETVGFEIPAGETVTLKGFMLSSTKEKIRVPDHLVGRVEGKSSLARLGLFVHVTAGFIDPGFEGFITLELFCANGRGIVLYPNMPIVQISFERMRERAANPYGSGATGSKYQGAERGPTPSRYHKNFPLGSL